MAPSRLQNLPKNPQGLRLRATLFILVAAMIVGSCSDEKSPPDEGDLSSGKFAPTAQLKLAACRTDPAPFQKCARAILASLRLSGEQIRLLSNCDVTQSLPNASDELEAARSAVIAQCL